MKSFMPFIDFEANALGRIVTKGAIGDARNGQLCEDVCFVEEGNAPNTGHSLDDNVDMSRQVFV